MQKRSWFLLLICLVASTLWARPDSTASITLSTPLPIDPEITSGQLENGLRYYIKVNPRPEHRAELRLAVNAGSILEDDDQQGLAHLVEHMAFNGTKNFARNQLVNYLESIGMKFGPEINAYTGFDETVYMLQVPTDSLSILKTGLSVLKDWAHQVTFDSVEIDKERGVVIEEWRQGRGADARMFDQQLPVILHDSHYADRLPIGKKEILETFRHNTLHRFYQTWYRPDLMAVVAVGDFDRDWMEMQIKQLFSQIPPVDSPRPRVQFAVPDHAETLVTIATDPEATGTSVSLYYKTELPSEATVGDYRRSLVEQLYSAMFNNRLDELTQDANPPFIYAFAGKGRLVRTKQMFYLGAGVPDGGVARGLATLYTEANRVRQHGFTDSELERTKKQFLRQIDRALHEKDKTESGQYAAEYIRNFLQQEPIPGIAYEHALYQTYLSGITVAEVNALAAHWLTETNRVILVNAPEKPDAPLPSEAELLQILTEIAAQPTAAYEDKTSNLPLLAELPLASEIRQEKFHSKLNVTEWQLGNGVRVVLKPTDFKNEEILFTAHSPGGTSLVADQNYIAALTASALVRESGVGPFDNIELQKHLAGKVVRVAPYISQNTEGISGNAAPQDLETLFQLIYLYFTQPREDSTAFLSYQSRLKSFIENRSADPVSAFEDTFAVVSTQRHFRTRPWTPKVLDEMNLAQSYQIYQNRFADAGDFTFVFVGNFALEKIKPLVRHYLGGLPAIQRREIWRDVRISSPAGIIQKEVHQGLEPKSRVQILFHGDYQWSLQNNYELDSMTDLLRIKLREVLREEKSGTYGVEVQQSTSHFPKPVYEIHIEFGCAPERVQELVANVFQQIDSLRQFEAAPGYLAKITETQLREREVNLKENRFWLNSLNSYYLHGQKPEKLLDLSRNVAGLNTKKIKKAARKYLDPKNYIQVVLLPAEIGGQ